MATKEAKKQSAENEVMNKQQAAEQPKQQQDAKAAAKEAEAAQKELEKKTKELEKCLKDLENKKKLASHRAKFIDVLDKLQEIKNELQPSDDFETDAFSLSFNSRQNYGKAEFTISNVAIILDFIGYMEGRIEVKIAELENQLIK